MGEGSSLLTRRGFVLFRRFLLALILLAMISAGFWMLNQVLDSVIVFGRGYVDVPGYPTTVDVWSYHDAAYALLWIAYVILVLWEIAPWKPGRLTMGKVIVILFGFALLTSALWISQDLMNAVLNQSRASVDLPFFVAKLDLYQTRDAVMLLVLLSFVSFYILNGVTRQD